MNYRYADVEYNVIPQRIYYPDGIIMDLSAENAVWYYNNISTEIPGIDVRFFDEKLYLNKYFNVEFKVEFPVFDEIPTYNVPMFEIYVNSADNDDFIARFRPVYNEGMTSWSSSMFTEEFVIAQGIESYIWQYASDGWVGFSLNFENLETQLTSNNYQLTDIKCFGIRFYIDNPYKLANNFDTDYTFGIRNVSCGSTPVSMTEGKIYLKTYGNGKVKANGRLVY